VPAVPVSRFTRLQESPADTSNECGDFTRYHLQTKIAVATARVHAQTRLRRTRASVVWRRGAGFEIARSLNEMGWFAYHGKSIENCLLLLDLSRFLKL
jgi:hypothetical protein